MLFQIWRTVNHRDLELDQKMKKKGGKKDHERRRMDTRERIPGNAEFKFTVNEKLRPMWKYLRIY